MGKIRGFKLGKRLIRVSKWICRKIRIQPSYQRIGSPTSPARKPIANKLLTWGRQLTKRARSLCAGSGYIPIGADPIQDKPRVVPKGHLAVYVGQKDGEFHRVLVPVFYFNHPLFGELLKEAEKEFGFQHPGGITLPCQLTEFERVKTRIASGWGGCGRRKACRRKYSGV